MKHTDNYTKESKIELIEWTYTHKKKEKKEKSISTLIVFYQDLFNVFCFEVHKQRRKKRTPSLNVIQYELSR